MDARHDAGHRGGGRWWKDRDDEVLRHLKEPSVTRGGGTHLSLSNPQTNQFFSDPSSFFTSPTLSLVTRGLKEGDRGGSPPQRQRGGSCPSQPPTEPPPRPEPGAHRPHTGGRRRRKAPLAAASELLPSLAPGGAAAPRPSPWSPLAAEWGLRKGRSVPRGAEAAFAPAPAPCGSGVSESGPRGAQDGGGGRGGGGGGGPSPAAGRR